MEGNNGSHQHRRRRERERERELGADESLKKAMGLSTTAQTVETRFIT